MLLQHVRPACAAALAASMALLVRPAAAYLHHTPAVTPGATEAAAHHARPHLPPRAAPRPAAAVAAPAAPVLDLAAANTGGNADRAMCLAISAGAGAAYECGDLRLAHALPVTRTMNRARGPVLLYSSQHAQPYPIVAANVRLPQGAGVPASVTATLFVNNARQATDTWAGSQWTSGSTRRISLGFDAASLPTAIYSARLEVSFWYGGNAQTASATQDLVIVNRSASKYRPGWWPAGLEQIYGGRTDGRVLWVGGDGSTRIYTPASGTTWAAPSLTRPDTLIWRADLNLYQRKLPGGTSVWYGPGGQHVQTSNRIGQTTDFAYNGDLSLASITLPAGGAARPAYRFTYAGQQLSAVDAPDGRRTAIAYDAAARKLSITDPDGFATAFTFGASDWRIARRTDRGGTVTAYTFAGTRLAQSRVYATGAAPDAADPVTTFRPAETLGMNGEALDTVLVYTRLDGPRADGDTTGFWLDRRGAPWKIRGALGDSTLVFREDARFPAAATRSVSVGGVVSRAYLNARGNPDSVKAVDPLGDGRDAVTRYSYGNALWPDFPTLTTGPEGELTRTDYDGNGNALWQEDARGTRSRVTFAYYGVGPWHGMPQSSAGPLTAPELIFYDASLGNLSETRSPLGFRTLVQTDAAGRVTETRSPIDGAGLVQTVQTYYDAMDRDTLVRTSGPAMSYLTANAAPGAPAVQAEWTAVAKRFDAAGNVTSVTTSAQPEVVGPETTEYGRDALGRIVRQAAPGKTTLYSYDVSGNVLDTWNGRGKHVRSTYDVMNRVVMRITDAVAYPATTCEGHPYEPGYCEYRFPLYPDSGGTGLTIPADTATFAYDASGAMTAAHNRWARVDRTYYRNGQLRTDTLRVRRYADGTGKTAPDGCVVDATGATVCPLATGGVEVASAAAVAGDPYPDDAFATHVYGIGYQYDRSGRVTRLDHPAALAPAAGAATRYAYTSWGALYTVDDALGSHYAFSYDDEGRPTRTDLPGGVVDTRRYDADGRSTWHQVTTADQTLSVDSMEYDARGKVLRQLSLGGPLGEQTVNHYSGLGTLLASEWGSATLPTVEEYRGDPLGRTSWSRTQSPQAGGSIPTYSYAYHRGSSAVEQKVALDLTGLQQSYSPDTVYSRFDAAGNAERSGARSYAYMAGGAPGWLGKSAQNSYYGGDDRLAVVQRYDWKQGADGSGTYDEYRYDALGRRVLVRSRRDGLCDASSTDCESSIQRFVWAGDELLYEIPAPGSSSLPVSQLENDHPVGERYGVVAYTHAGGIDAPLGVIRMGYPNATSTLIVPHANYRGTYHAGTDASGHLMTCVAADGCIHVVWPAPYRGAYYQGSTPPGDWIGSLVTGQQDATGLMYRRNRYYNPQTGQFTQSDPIGIAGGLNTYGFADGDPTSYSDPFGLCTRADGWKDCDKMIDFEQSLAILDAAYSSGEWRYTQGGARGGQEPPVDLARRQGDCTDFTWSATKTALGSAWPHPYSQKPSTAMFLAGQAQGYTEVESSAARPGDVVVLGGHAGLFEGWDGDHALGQANNGSPAKPNQPNRDGKTGTYDFGARNGNQPHFYRPTVEKKSEGH